MAETKGRSPEVKKKITVSQKGNDTAGKPSSKPAAKKNASGKATLEKAKYTPPSDKLCHKLLPFLWFVLAVTLFLCFTLRDVFGLKADENLFGPVGEAIHALFFGLLGGGAYLIILVFVYLGIMWRRLVDRHRVAVKIIFMSSVILLISALLQVFVSDATYPGIEWLWTNGNELVGGGFVGGSLGWLSFAGLKTVGSVVIIFPVIAVLIMLLFDMTPYNVAVYIKAKRKLKAERRAEEEAARLATEAEDEIVTESKYTSYRRKQQLDEPDSSKAKETVKEETEPANDEIFDDGFFGDVEKEETVERQSEENASETKDFALKEVFNEDRPKREQKIEPEKEEIEETADGLIPDDGNADNVDVLAITTDTVSEPTAEPEKPKWNPPPIDLLVADTSSTADLTESIIATKKKLRATLDSFGIKIKDIGYSIGPTITRYEVVPEAGVRVRAIANLVDDIAMNLATVGVRIEAPIPNKPAVGVEVPNEVQAIVHLRTLLETETFINSSPLTVCLGQDVAGKNIYFDIKKMPHMIIAGTTGSGKSVCINGIVTSLLYKNSPDQVKMIMIDPKKVEFSIYQHIPHLYCPIISDPRKAAGALASAVAEMERRYTLVEDVGVRDIDSYNKATANDPDREYLPKLIIVIDELADLMMMAKADVEQFITRIAQKARAVGIHLIIGTQRPSVDVITGLIKANVPSRIACTVKSQVDSRTIIDIAGAEKLIGHGDMLFSPVGLAKPMRVQGAFLEDAEVARVVDYIKSNNAPVQYNSDFMASMEAAAANVGEKKTGGAALDAADMSDDSEDAKFRRAVEIAINENKVSTSLLQRKLEIGYGRAAKIIDRMEELGYVSGADGNKPRQILITKQEFYEKVVNEEVTANGE